MANPVFSGYELYFELGDKTAIADNKISAYLDEQLGLLNLEYQVKRESNRLKPVNAFPCAREPLNDLRQRACRKASGKASSKQSYYSMRKTSFLISRRMFWNRRHDACRTFLNEAQNSLQSKL